MSQLVIQLYVFSESRTEFKNSFYRSYHEAGASGTGEPFPANRHHCIHGAHRGL